jgi:hypothetical protein
VQWFPGLRDLEAGEYPSSFTVVPILALDTATFAQIIYTDRNETHLGLCKKLIEFNPKSGESVIFFRRQPRLAVIGGETEVPPGCLDGYCASKALCTHHGADTPTTSSDPQCPGCRSAVHAECGYFRRNVDNKWDSVTCFMCFKHYGRAMRAVNDHTHSKQKADESKADKSPVKQKPNGSSQEESSNQKANESEAEKRSKPKADESEADKDNSDENRLHEDPRRVGLSNFIHGQRPSGLSSVIKSHSTTPPKSLTPSQLKKKRKYDKAVDNQNPSNMYPSGRLAQSTTSGYETK